MVYSGYSEITIRLSLTSHRLVFPMKFSNGNAKLGENCLVVSRPVGDSCPSSCSFLGDGCYAEHTEKLFTNSRKFAMPNMITDQNKIRSMLVYAHSQGKSVRIHERGDFFKGGKLDLPYLNNWISALESIKPESRPKIWVYTHIYDKRILTLGKLGVNVYASVDNAKQMKKAKKVGFTLIAWADKTEEFAKRKSHRNKVNHLAELPTYLAINNENFLVCPEMRKGRESVTCSGTSTSVACKMCFSPSAKNVVFLKH